MNVDCYIYWTISGIDLPLSNIFPVSSVQLYKLAHVDIEQADAAGVLPKLFADIYTIILIYTALYLEIDTSPLFECITAPSSWIGLRTATECSRSSHSFLSSRSTNSVVRLHQTHAVSHTIRGLCIPRGRCPVVSLSLRLNWESELQDCSCVLTIYDETINIDCCNY